MVKRAQKEPLPDQGRENYVGYYYENDFDTGKMFIRRIIIKVRFIIDNKNFEFFTIIVIWIIMHWNLVRYRTCY